MARGADLGEMETAVRIWTLKEAVAKAFDMTLAESWNRVRVISVGSVESRFLLDGGEPRTAVHDEADGHLFTLVVEEHGPDAGRGSRAKEPPVDARSSPTPVHKPLHGYPCGPPQKDF